MQTELQANKCLKKVEGVLTFIDTAISGYEIHAGISHGQALKKPMMMLAAKADGAISDDNQVMGTYLHGLFDSANACNEILHWAGYTKQQSINLDDRREQGINLITDALVDNFDFDKLQNTLNEFADYP